MTPCVCSGSLHWLGKPNNFAETAFNPVVFQIPLHAYITESEPRLAYSNCQDSILQDIARAVTDEKLGVIVELVWKSMQSNLKPWTQRKDTVFSFQDDFCRIEMS